MTGQRKAALGDRETPRRFSAAQARCWPVVAPASDTKRLFLGGLHHLFWEHISRSCKLHVPLPSPAAQLASPLHHLLGHFFPIPSAFLQHVSEYSFHENWAFPSLFISSCFKLCLSTLTLSQTPGLCLRMSPKVSQSWRGNVCN